MEYIKNIYRDEMRDGFLVTADRKKIWQVEMELLAELDGICRRHGLRYFVDYGTLLGAVRHRGFIPWDDDIDVVMMRPDYERLKLVIAREGLREPFFFQTTYTDDIELWIGKLMNKGTSGVQDFSTDRFCQGIFLDIWPMDAAPDGAANGDELKQCYLELMYAVMAPDKLLRDLDGRPSTRINAQVLKKLCQMPFRWQWGELEKFLQRHFADSDQVGVFTMMLNGREAARPKAWYNDVVMLPFETIEVPAPAGWQEILDSEYGDWHKFVKFASDHNGTVFSADVPYKELIAAHRADAVKNKGEA